MRLCCNVVLSTMMISSNTMLTAVTKNVHAYDWHNYMFELYSVQEGDIIIIFFFQKKIRPVVVYTCSTSRSSRSFLKIIYIIQLR